MTPLVIIGTGGGAYDVLDIVDAINAIRPTWDVQGFLDDFRHRGSSFLNWPVLGALADARQFEQAQFINVIGSDKSYLKRAGLIGDTGLSRDRFATLIHPASGVSSRATLGRGVYVNYGVSVAGNVKVGDHVALSPGCIIGHDTTIGDHTLIAPGAVISGYVTIGCCAYIGAQAVIRQKLNIGDRSLVGMGAVVTRDVPVDSVVYGNPGRVREEALS